MPTTEEIREGYTQWSLTDEGAIAAGEVFDEWLVEHDREVAGHVLETLARAMAGGSVTSAQLHREADEYRKGNYRVVP